METLNRLIEESHDDLDQHRAQLVIAQGDLKDLEAKQITDPDPEAIGFVAAVREIAEVDRRRQERDEAIAMLKASIAELQQAIRETEANLKALEHHRAQLLELADRAAAFNQASKALFKELMEVVDFAKSIDRHLHSKIFRDQYSPSPVSGFKADIWQYLGMFPAVAIVRRGTQASLMNAFAARQCGIDFRAD